jgi:hypothetical protein
VKSSFVDTADAEYSGFSAVKEVSCDVLDFLHTHTRARAHTRVYVCVYMLTLHLKCLYTYNLICAMRLLSIKSAYSLANSLVSSSAYFQP